MAVRVDIGGSEINRFRDTRNWEIETYNRLETAAYWSASVPRRESKGCSLELSLLFGKSSRSDAENLLHIAGFEMIDASGPKGEFAVLSLRSSP